MTFQSASMANFRFNLYPGSDTYQKIGGIKRTVNNKVADNQVIIDRLTYH